ncbi:MAG TPA: hypothetical protein VGC44_00615 [Longimicrobiales bacterium]
MRSIRRLSQLFLTVSGAGTVMYAVLAIEPLRDRLLVAALGLLIMEIGIWQLTRIFFPNEREFKPLREETDYFLKLVRRLNAQTLRLQAGSNSAQAEVDRLREEMFHSVDRMCRLAGRTEEEMALTTVKPSWRKMSKLRPKTATQYPDPMSQPNTANTATG